MAEHRAEGEVGNMAGHAGHKAGHGTGKDGPAGADRYEVVVIGGGAAGLSGALTLARARRSVLVIDAGEPRNAPADGVHVFLTREGTPPGELLAAGRAEVTGYGGEIRNGTVVAAERHGEDGFRVVLDDGTAVGARRLLVATGLTDELPKVPGLAERWGREVLHCPFCHGWEVRDQAIGVLGTGPLSVHQALLWRQWSEDITLFLHTAPEPDEEQREQLAARGITVVDGEVTGLTVTDDRLTAVRLAGGREIPCRALAVATRLTARAGLLTGLGVEVGEQERGGHVIGSRVAADVTGATSVPGVWVAGNVTEVTDQVVTAAAAGVRAGAAINADLMAEETRRAVATYRAGGPVAEFWDGFYAERDRVWSGKPNGTLVEEAGDLPPGRALDLGCGEGADAIWLARRGWRVTATDVARTALDRAAGHAREAGVADAIDWQRHDLADSFPEGTFDLVSAHFLHSPVDLPRERILRAAAAAVAPGGVLLIAGHAGWPSWVTDADPGIRFPTPEEVLADLSLPEGQWEVLRSETHDRAMTDPDGHPATRPDNVLKLRRLPA